MDIELDAILCFLCERTNQDADYVILVERECMFLLPFFFVVGFLSFFDALKECHTNTHLI